MSTPLQGLQQGIYERLTDDAALMALVTGVYDEVPEPAAYPYITIGDAIETPDNTHDGLGAEVVETVHVWSEARGYSRALAAANRVIELLDYQPMTIPGHSVLAFRREFVQTLRDPDPTIRHIIARFRVTTEQE